MGGAIATRAAAKEVIKSLIGLVIIDVVEGGHYNLSCLLIDMHHDVGTAMDSLGSMQSYLRSRPKSFMSLETAIEWRYKRACACFDDCMVVIWGGPDCRFQSIL